MADLLLALDVKGKSEAVRVANACTGEVDAIKIGYPLVLSTGLGIVKDLAKADIPIIADFKVADIPNTNSLICDEVFGAGCSGIITHAFCGHDSLAACVDSAHDHGGVCFVVCEMSHPGALEFLRWQRWQNPQEQTVSSRRRRVRRGRQFSAASSDHP